MTTTSQMANLQTGLLLETVAEKLADYRATENYNILSRSPFSMTPVARKDQLPESSKTH